MKIFIGRDELQIFIGELLFSVSCFSKRQVEVGVQLVQKKEARPGPLFLANAARFARPMKNAVFRTGCPALVHSF